MATQQQIFDLRIIIDDPAGFTYYSTHPNQAAFPATGKVTTAYYSEADLLYFRWSGGVYVEITTIVYPDEVLEQWIDENDSVNYAACTYFKIQMNRITKKLTIVKDTTGQETTEFTKLTDQASVFKDLCYAYTKKYQSESGGNIGVAVRSTPAIIAGGDL